MARKESIRITMRLSAKDADIISIFEYYKPRTVICFAVQRYLTGSNNTLAIPPAISDKPVLYRAFVINRADAPAVYDFLVSAPAGKRSDIIKRLIRHATDRCDLRQLLAVAEQAPTLPPPLQPPQPRAAFNEDDDADGIEPEAESEDESNAAPEPVNDAGQADERPHKKRRRRKRKPHTDQAGGQPEYQAPGQRAPAPQDERHAPPTPKPAPVHEQHDTAGNSPDSIFNLI